MLAIAVAAAASLFAGTPARAELIWKAISINFTNSSNLLSSSAVAGNASEGSFTNWNNMTSGTALSSLTRSDGETTGVNLAIWTGTNGSSSPNFATTTGQPNGYSSGIVINTALAAPTSPASADDSILYAAGANANSTNGPGGLYQANTFSLAGLNTAFPNGYKVYVYQSAGAAANTTGSWGSITASGSTGGTANFGANPFVATTNVAYTYGTAGSTSAAYGFQSNTAFNGTYTVNKFMTITQTGGAVITSDVFALTNYVYSLITGAATNQLVNGVQVVGQVEVVPEPAVLGIAAAGAACFMVLGVMRRKALRSARVSEGDSEERLDG